MKLKAILAALLLSVSAITFAAEVNPAPAAAPAPAAQTAAPAAKKPQKKSALMEMLPIIVMVVIMIFLFSRSNKKQAQKRMEMLDRIVKGSRVLLNSGVYAKVVEVKENDFLVEIADNVRVLVVKEGIARVMEEEKKEDEEEVINKMVRILEKMDKDGRSDKKLRKAVRKVKEESLPKLDEYDKHLEILGERNSYSKTDPDATFMHMKEDAMNNGQTKPGYNVQIATENQYIVNYDLYWRPTDYGTLIPFLESFYDKFGFYSSEIVADSGYGSEQNYEFMFANGMTPYVKYNMFHKEMKRKFLKNPFHQANMFYNQEQDFYVCPMGQHMEHITDKRTVSDLGYISNTSVYRAANCSKCPLRGMCYSGKCDRRTIEVNHKANSYKSSAKTLLTSQRGLMHRSNRPIEPEACFGNIKFNHGFKRFHLKSTRKTKVEWGLVSLAHNLRKYVAYKAKSKKKQAQSMVLVLEKPALKPAV